MKKILSIIFCLLFILCSCKDNKLPLPEVEDGLRGELGIDKNINEKTIDNFLNRSDSVYRDLRMLKDSANYEAIGGDSSLSGFIEGFEVVPFPYICNVVDLPSEVGYTYDGVTLFTYQDGEYLQNYEESLEIIESLFPRDKNIFLMCGGGGYAGMMKKLLVYFGYDENKIYNVGGYWYYDGQHKVDTTYIEDDEVHYNFALVNYHDINFNTLSKIRDSGNNHQSDIVIGEDFIMLDNLAALTDIENNVQTFILYVYLDGCTSCASFYPIVKEFKDNNDVDVYAIRLSDIYKTTNEITKRISYTPSVFIYKDKEVLAYLDPGSEEDLPIYKSIDNFTSWFNSVGNINDYKNTCDSCTVN